MHVPVPVLAVVISHVLVRVPPSHVFVHVDQRLHAPTQSSLDDEDAGVDDELAGVDDEDMGVDDEDTGVDDEDAGVDDELAGVDDELAGVDDELAGVDDAGVTKSGHASARIACTSSNVLSFWMCSKIKSISGASPSVCVNSVLMSFLPFVQSNSVASKSSSASVLISFGTPPMFPAPYQ